jgi:hypothetical protein
MKWLPFIFIAAVYFDATAEDTNLASSLINNQSNVGKKDCPPEYEPCNGGHTTAIGIDFDASPTGGGIDWISIENKRNALENYRYKLENQRVKVENWRVVEQKIGRFNREQYDHYIDSYKSGIEIYRANVK